VDFNLWRKIVQSFRDLLEEEFPDPGSCYEHGSLFIHIFNGGISFKTRIEAFWQDRDQPDKEADSATDFKNGSSSFWGEYESIPLLWIGREYIKSPIYQTICEKYFVCWGSLMKKFYFWIWTCGIWDIKNFPVITFVWQIKDIYIVFN